MKTHGFIRVAAASPVVRLADVKANVREICALIERAADQGVSILAFPELSLTGSTCGDLLRTTMLVEAAARGVEQIRSFTEGLAITVIIGAPLLRGNQLYSSAVVIKDGKVADGDASLFSVGGVRFAVEVGEDFMCREDAEIIFHLSGSGQVALTQQRRRETLRVLSAQHLAGYVLAANGYGESTQDEVFAGGSLIYENGLLLQEGERFALHATLVAADIDVEALRFQRRNHPAFKDAASGPECVPVDLGAAADTDFEGTLLREVDPHPFLVKGDLDEGCREILSLQALGLMTRLEHIHCRKAVLGISGGLDSTLALLVAVLAFDRLGLPRENILCITMPGLGTSGRTHGNAWKLMEKLGVTAREIPISAAVTQHFQDIGHDDSTKDTTYENAQARERTQILMDIANQTGAIVIGTGDLSELALGWCTYNGDHMSMYGVNGSVPKTLVRQLCTWAAGSLFPEAGETLLDIVDTPISPELKKDSQEKISQRTEDLIGPYELNDFFLYHFLRYGHTPEKIYFLARVAFQDKYDDETILRWIRNFFRRFFSQQFKRSCMPDGPKVTEVSLSPRGAWEMPSDASADLFVLS